MKRAVLFDLDGTVLDSQTGVFRSIEYAMNKLHLTMPPQSDLIAFLGPPIHQGFTTVCHVPPHLVEDAVTYYREYYNDVGKFEASIYAGIADTLQRIRQDGKRCYITTSKPQVFAKQILSHFGITDLFDEIYGCELDGTRSEKADVLAYCLEQQGLKSGEVILVGDRLYDVNGAQKLSMECVGILYGYGTREELEAAGATYICDNTDELYTLLRSL